MEEITIGQPQPLLDPSPSAASSSGGERKDEHAEVMRVTVSEIGKRDNELFTCKTDISSVAPKEHEQQQLQVDDITTEKEASVQQREGDNDGSERQLENDMTAQNQQKIEDKEVERKTEKEEEEIPKHRPQLELDHGDDVLRKTGETEHTQTDQDKKEVLEEKETPSLKTPSEGSSTISASIDTPTFVRSHSPTVDKLEEVEEEEAGGALDLLLEAGGALGLLLEAPPSSSLSLSTSSVPLIINTSTTLPISPAPTSPSPSVFSSTSVPFTPPTPLIPPQSSIVPSSPSTTPSSNSASFTPPTSLLTASPYFDHLPFLNSSPMPPPSLAFNSPFPHSTSSSSSASPSSKSPDSEKQAKRKWTSLPVYASLTRCQSKHCTCRPQDLYCFSQAHTTCKELGGKHEKMCRWYHVSASEHYCNLCFEHYYRKGKAGNPLFEKWKIPRLEWSSTLAAVLRFMCETSLPYLRALCSKCGKWRLVARNMNPTELSKTIEEQQLGKWECSNNPKKELASCEQDEDQHVERAFKLLGTPAPPDFSFDNYLTISVDPMHARFEEVATEAQIAKLSKVKAETPSSLRFQSPAPTKSKPPAKGKAKRKEKEKEKVSEEEIEGELESTKKTQLKKADEKKSPTKNRPPKKDQTGTKKEIKSSERKTEEEVEPREGKPQTARKAKAKAKEVKKVPSPTTERRAHTKGREIDEEQEIGKETAKTSTKLSENEEKENVAKGKRGRLPGPTNSSKRRSIEDGGVKTTSTSTPVDYIPIPLLHLRIAGTPEETEKEKKMKAAVDDKGDQYPAGTILIGESTPLEKEDYFIDCLVKKRTNQRGENEYLVRWLGYPDSENQWVNEKDIDEWSVSEFERQSLDPVAPHSENSERGVAWVLFWKFVACRQKVWETRQRLEKGEKLFVVVQDNVLAKESFANVYRELDKGTIYLQGQIEKLRTKVEESKVVVWMSICFRLVNRIETFASFGGIPAPNDFPTFAKFLEDLHKKGETIFTARHNTLGFERYIKAMEEVLSRLDTLSIQIINSDGMEEVCRILTNVNGIGLFFAHQIACDLAEAHIYGHPEVVNMVVIPTLDENVWCYLGPGAREGLRAIFPSAIKRSNNQSALLPYARKLQKEQKEAFEKLGLEFVFWEGKELTLKNIEHALCEFFKYYRALIKATTKKRKLSENASKLWAGAAPPKVLKTSSH